MRLHPHRVALALIAAPAILSPAGGARACSCGGPRVHILTPDREDDAPLNTRVRFEGPRPGSAGRRVLRVQGSGVEIAVDEHIFPSGDVDVVELKPRAPLAPSTRYEVAFVDPAEHPSTLVFGTFQTGTGADTAAPLLKNGGAVEAHRNVSFGGGDCSIRGPWIDVRGAVAEDPSRPNAQILWGVWPKDLAGKIDASHSPTTILAAWRGVLTLGRRSLCDPHGFPLPDAGVFSFGIAPLDEAGNAGPLTVHRVDMSAATPEARR